MAAKKGFGDTVLGWFVVREEDEDDNAAAEEAPEKREKKAAPPPAPAGKPAPKAAPKSEGPAKAAAPARPAAAPAVQLKGAPPIIAGTAPDAKVFAEVYRAANISDAEQERVEKALNLVQTLPSETPREVKKQIVEASMKAFGIPIDEIIEAGVQEIQALDAYIKHGEHHTAEVLTDASARVEKLEAEIAEVRRLMDLQVSTQQALTRASNEQKLRVQAVLEFFGQEEVARIVKASPKLIEPK